jgi:RimJ/RimL family protein N-acetyltransferase
VLFFSPFLINPGGQKEWYKNILADRNRVVLMIDTLEGKTVGMVSLVDIDWRNQLCEGGQFILDPDQRTHGYALEAATLVINYAFEELNISRINGYTYSFNQPSNCICCSVLEWRA